MIVSCPSCATHFSIPDSALGPRGRTLRCARCGHRWHEVPDEHKDDEIPLEMAPAEDVATPLAVADKPEPSVLPDRLGFSLGADDGSFRFDSGTPKESAPETNNSSDSSSAGEPSGDDSFARIAELMMKSVPEPIPEVFASPPPRSAPPRRGTAGLWLLVLVLLLGCIGAVLYFFQDQVIDHVPQAAPIYEKLNIGKKVVGAGLMFRNTDSERVMQNDSEVLVVRGVIANTTNLPRDIPPLRLALYNNHKLLQEKVINPPQTSLDALATVGFRITLDRPDAEATKFEVTFGAPPPAEKN